MFDDKIPVNCLQDQVTLPGGSYGQAFKLRRTNLTSAQERLEFVLWFTFEQKRNWEWGNTGLHDKFNDAKYHNGFSNQIRHFLQAVAHSYEQGDAAYVLPCLVGHELGGRPNEPVYACALGLTYMGSLTTAAYLDSERPIGYLERLEGIIQTVLPGYEYDESRASNPSASQQAGASREDLRLTIKGYTLGQAVKKGRIQGLVDVQNWLRNLAPNRNT